MMWLWLLMFGCASHAITFEHVLKTAWEDKTYLSYDQMQSTDSVNPFRTVEGIASNEKDGYSRAELGLKFNLKAWSEWKAGASLKSEQSLLKQSSLAWALKIRYNTLLLYQLNKIKADNISEQIKLSEQYLKAQGVALRSGRLTAKAFLSSESDIFKLQRTQVALLQEREVLQKRLQIWIPNLKNEELAGTDLIGIEDISQKIESQPSVSESLTRKISKQEIAQIEQELQIVNGRENQWIKSLQLSHVVRNDEDRFKVELTLQLPFLAQDDLSKQKQNDLILKKALKQRDLDETADQLENIKMQISNLIGLYRTAQKLHINYKIKTLDPLLNAERLIIEQQEKFELLNQQQAITMLYLDYLLESEVLTKNPEKNYLDRGLKSIL
ncbi:MAG: hypothetical protein ACXVCP_06195 [Bdellovibrio sp.]